MSREGKGVIHCTIDKKFVDMFDELCSADMRSRSNMLCVLIKNEYERYKNKGGD